MTVDVGHWCERHLGSPVENVLFASEMVGAVKGIDPETGHRFDDTRRYIDGAAHLAAAQRNADRGFPDGALFEVGPQYRDDTPQGQELMASGMRAGRTGPKRWDDPGRPVDALLAKAARGPLESLLMLVQEQIAAVRQELEASQASARLMREPVTVTSASVSEPGSLAVSLPVSEATGAGLCA